MTAPFAAGIVIKTSYLDSLVAELFRFRSVYGKFWGSCLSEGCGCSTRRFRLIWFLNYCSCGWLFMLVITGVWAPALSDIFWVITDERSFGTVKSLF